MQIDNIEKIGISAPGTCIDGTIVIAKNLKITNYNIVEAIEKHYIGIKVTLSNDGKCAGMCEKKYGALKEYSDCIFLCLGTGVGGAVFLNGQMLKKKNNMGFEMGHIVISVDGKKCSCGNFGCIESYCSMKNLKDSIGIRKGINNIHGKDVYEILKNDIESVKDIVDEYIKYLSIAITNYVNLFEPEAICLGGSFIYYEDILLKMLIDYLNKNNMTFNRKIPNIVVAQYGNDAGIIGATLN